jgi:glutathione synthase/RimK-type ligase-like ATP-grasp enzyme
MKSKIKVVICGNEIKDDHQTWINSCEYYKEKVDFAIIDLTKNTWLEEIKKHQADVYLLKPGGYNSTFKQLYDERVLIMEEELGLKLYPSRKEVFIYENKRFFSFWLKANNIQHPKTDVFYFQNEALKHLNHVSFPIVAKTNIGASGAGVTILKNNSDATQYVKDVFSGKGATKRVGPNLEKGGLFLRAMKLLFNPKKLKTKFLSYSIIAKSSQTEFVILQEFIPHNFEWRVVRIGDSFFAHKKLLSGEKASGSLLKGYENPPLDLLDFVKKITDKHGFYSQAVDVFESDRGYLVNEMQCIFGQSDSFQMKVDGIIGRYLYINNQWVFEQGDFNSNQSYNLRLEHIIRQVK